MKFTLRREDEQRHWPGYLFGGRVRTSTVALLVAFGLIWWVYETYSPAAHEPPESVQVVPPGFVPDPAYTWVPRTKVQVPTTTVAPTETTEPTETSTTTPETSPETTPQTTGPVDTTGPEGGPTPFETTPADDDDDQTTPSTAPPGPSPTTSIPPGPGPTPAPTPPRAQ